MEKLSLLMKKRQTLSFEVFPPKTDKPIEPLQETLCALKNANPDFISCTYGAGGTNAGRQSEILSYIHGLNLRNIAHYTCIGNSKKDIQNYIKTSVNNHVDGVLALRGDYPPGQEGTAGDFKYGCELIAFIRSQFPYIEIAGGVYPEKHLKSIDMAQEFSIMKEKQASGADFFMSQLCYDLDGFLRFKEKALHLGIVLPIDFGFLPVLNKDGIIRMALSNGCSIPKELAELIGKYGLNPDSFKEAGIEFSVRFIERALSEGIDGLHLYTLNKSEDVLRILRCAGIIA